MRPRSIVRFEQLYLLSLAIGLVLMIYSWDASVAVARQAGGGPIMVGAIQAVTFAIMLGLVLLTSRAASVLAKWVLVLFFLGGMAMMLIRPALTFGAGPILAVQVAQILLQLAGIYLLAQA